MMVTLHNEYTRQIKEAKVGFSWTMFFFGALVPLFRGDFKWFLLTLLLDSISLGIAGIVLSFKYNQIYINGLIEKGYVPWDGYSRDVLISEGIY